MPITPQQIQNAQNRQHAAAHDNSSQVRLIAGPGSGKSFAIQERVYWLLNSSIPPESIFVISFTRASTLDLKSRIIRYCQDNGNQNGDRVNVSTLHSLALRSLRSAGLLAYPADPLVMDDWELENILDIEFSRTSRFTPGRCKQIRIDYEAFCGTGQWLPPNHIPPDPPISKDERADYLRFHNPRTQTYSCVLPGEIVRQCVERMETGQLDPANLLRIQHLIVDEYQDLNPSDLDFVDRLIDNGIDTFVAGDDDQSIYSFRFASPQGIQSFKNRYPQTGDHQLRECFRCTPMVLRSAQSLMAYFSEPDRIPKSLVSLYEESNPSIQGIVHRWKFPSFIREARSIAESCSALIENGIPPHEIMILLSNKRALLPILKQELENVNVNFEAPKSGGFQDTKPGRFILATLRIVCNPDDYVAHRLILGLRPHVGPTICNNVAQNVLSNNLNFKDIFYRPLPTGVFQGRQLTAINLAREACSHFSGWSSDDTLVERSLEISEIMSNLFGDQAYLSWQAQINHLPPEIILEELRDYLLADTDEQQAALLETTYTRLGIPIPEGGLLPQKVRIMTMHGAKGLSAQVVFIPGLMEEILPGNLRRPYPGLVLEAARMLYVSITRGRAVCILSYSETRIVYGKFSGQTPSTFASHLSGSFEPRENGLLLMEIEEIIRSCRGLY